MCVAVPVCSPGGQRVAALAISAPLARMSLEQGLQHVPLLRATADRLTATIDEAGTRSERTGARVSLTYDEIAEIIKLIDSSSCDELVVETGDMKLVVRRNGVSPAAAAEYTERGSAPVAVSPSPAPQARPPRQRSKRPRAKSSSRSDGRDFLPCAQPRSAAVRRGRQVVAYRPAALPHRSDEAFHNDQLRDCRPHHSNRRRERRTRRIRPHVIRHRTSLMRKRCRKLEGQKKQSIDTHLPRHSIKPKMGGVKCTSQHGTRFGTMAIVALAAIHLRNGSSGRTELHGMGLAAAL